MGRAVWYANDTPALPDGMHGRVGHGSVNASNSQETPGMAALLHETARAPRFNNRFDEALPLCEQALAMAERLGLAEVQAETLATMGILPNRSPEARRES